MADRKLVSLVFFKFLTVEENADSLLQMMITVILLMDDMMMTDLMITVRATPVLSVPHSSDTPREKSCLNPCFYTVFSY